MTTISRTIEQPVATVDVDDDGLVDIRVTRPLTVDEARAVARAVLHAAEEGARYAAEQEAAPSTREVVHGMPLIGLATTNCCGRSPFELPATDRITAQTHAVTCGKNAR